MSNRPKLLYPILTSLIAGLVVTGLVFAFTGPGTLTPGTGNPAFWAKSGYDTYYNVSGGDVGIGTNGPAYKLDVQGGQINSSGGLCIAGDCKTAWSQVQGVNYWTLSSSSLYPNLTTYNLGVGTASLDANYKITTSGGGLKAESTTQPAGYFSSTSGYGLIVNNGNVGIGIATPTARLHVYGAGSPASRIILQSTLNSDAQYQSITALGSWGWGTGYGVAENAFVIYDNNVGQRLKIDASGNVGIGTASPGAKLEVTGQVKITGGTPGANKVLTSDAVGLASWQAPSTSGVTLPTGAVFFMITGSCPSGTTDVTATYANRFLMVGSSQGTTGGASTVTLSEANLPSHSHTAGSLTGGAHTHSISSFYGTVPNGAARSKVDFTPEAGNYNRTWTGGDETYQRANSGGAVAVTGSTGAIGSGTAFNVVNPYVQSKLCQVN